MTIQIVILAGGMATRLRPLTETIPKILLPVADEPFAFHLLRLLAKKGFSRAVLLIGYEATQVMQQIGDGSKFGISVGYVTDGPELLGTGGAIINALDKLDDNFGVVYGDSWLDFDYQAAISKFRVSDRPALMTVYRNKDRWDKSNVEFDGINIKAYSKLHTTNRMEFIDYGFSIFNKSIFVGLPKQTKLDLSDIAAELISKQLLTGYEVRERFFEVGSFKGLEEFKLMFRKNISKHLP